MCTSHSAVCVITLFGGFKYYYVTWKVCMCSCEVELGNGDVIIVKIHFLAIKTIIRVSNLSRLVVREIIITKPHP